SAKLSIGFLGAGRMATALAKGFIRAGLVDGRQVMASDPSEAACLSFAKETSGKTTAFNPDVVKFARVLLLSVKPDQAGSVLSEIRDGFSDNHLLISIAAGITLTKLESGLPSGARVIRVMPNTPALVGESATAFTPGKGARPADAELAQKLFSSIGVAFRVKEALLDA